MRVAIRLKVKIASGCDYFALSTPDELPPIQDQLHSLMSQSFEVLFERPSACRTASPGKLTDFEDELFRNCEMIEVPVIMATSSSQGDGVRTLVMAYVQLVNFLRTSTSVH